MWNMTIHQLTVTAHKKYINDSHGTQETKRRPLSMLTQEQIETTIFWNNTANRDWAGLRIISNL